MLGRWGGYAAVVAGAAFLRFSALSWGAPFLYHPDEHFILHPALDIVRTGDPNPHWFQYPSLLIYAQALLIACLQPFVRAPLETSWIVNGIGPWDALPEQWPFVLGGRIVVAASAVAGIALLARVGERVHGRPAGLLAAAFLMAAALHNQSSHYLTTDVPATALVVAAVAASVSRAPRWGLAGLLAGLAAGTKYTAGIAVLVPLLAVLDGAPSEPAGRRRALLASLVRILLGFGAGFLLSTPYAVLDASAFREGLEAQRRNYFAWAPQPGNLQWYLSFLYEQGLGPALSALAGLGLLLGAARVVHAAMTRDRPGLRLALILPPLLYLPWIASYPSRAERNLIIVLPFLCLAAADTLRWACSFVRPAWLGSATLAALGGAVLWLALPAVLELNQRLLLPDNRTLALEWVRAHVPRGARIVREEYTPQIQKSEFDISYAFSLGRHPYSYYLDERVQFLVASSNVYGRAVEPPFIAGEAGRELYRIVFGLPLAAEFPQGPLTRGPTVRIYRVPLAPNG